MKASGGPPCSFHMHCHAGPPQTSVHNVTATQLTHQPTHLQQLAVDGEAQHGSHLERQLLFGAQPVHAVCCVSMCVGGGVVCVRQYMFVHWVRKGEVGRCRRAPQFPAQLQPRPKPPDTHKPPPHTHTRTHCTTHR